MNHARMIMCLAAAAIAALAPPVALSKTGAGGARSPADARGTDPVGSGADGLVAVAARTIRAGSVVTADAIMIPVAPRDGARVTSEAFDLDGILGREARVTIFKGDTVDPAMLARPTLVERNQRVTLVYSAGALEIRAEGRALGRGGEGDSVRAINTTSKQTVTAVVAADGTLRLAPNP
jgi:flagella basal body P-ring formation protein FlgA